MPISPKHPCNHPGCPNVTSSRFCEAHGRVEQQRLEQERPSAFERGYNARWHKAAKAYLMKHPFCAMCLKQRRLTAAVLVDHILPHKGDKKLFWDENNWQSGCKPCHDSKTATEDGRWGKKACR